MSEFPWGEYIELAEALLDAPLSVSGEAHWRVAVSRAYYGAFNTARKCLESEGFTFSGTGKDHLDVRKALETQPDRKRLSPNLRRLHERRKSADYDDVAENKLHKKAKSAVSMAKHIVDTLPSE